jgi:hypothetical protein
MRVKISTSLERSPKISFGVPLLHKKHPYQKERLSSIELFEGGNLIGKGFY